MTRAIERTILSHLASMSRAQSSLWQQDWALATKLYAILMMQQP